MILRRDVLYSSHLRTWRSSAGLEELWFQDLRRSFITNARRRVISEPAVMKMSGHRTRSVFDRYNIINERHLIEAIGLFQQKQEAELDEFRQDSVKVGSTALRKDKSRPGYLLRPPRHRQDRA